MRRFGEEMLFQDLRDQNTRAILNSGAKRIVTADPHAFHLKNCYNGLLPVEHISQVMARQVKAGTLKFKPLANGGKVYANHDPCYLGRHNQVYGDPRSASDAISGIKRVDMQRCKDRSFCCCCGPMLFYEPQEELRMGVLRVRMAA